MRKKYAPFCSNPNCDCAYADDRPCSEFMGCCYDVSGVERCGRCGNLEADHHKSRLPVSDDEAL